MADGKESSGGLRASRPGAKPGGAIPLRATISVSTSPGVQLRAEIGTSGRGATAAPLRPPGPRPAPPKSKLPLVMLVLVAVAAAGLWYFNRPVERQTSFPTPSSAVSPPSAESSAGSDAVASPSTSAGASAPGVPVIAGNQGPYKETPKDPGGVEVPFKENLVYNDLKPAPGQTPPQRVERLLPPPEEPLPKPAPVVPSTPVANVTPPAVAAGAPTADGSVAVGERPAVESVAQAKPELAASQPPAAPSGVLGQLPVAPGSPEAEALKAESEKSAPQQVPAPSNSPSTAASPPPLSPSPSSDAGSLEDVFRRLGTAGAGPAEAPATGPSPQVAADPAFAGAAGDGSGFRIQLASVRSEEEAAREWQRLSRRYPNELGSLSPVFERADLPQGTFFRVQAGPLSEAQARARCAALNGQPGVSGCQPVRRAAAP